MKQKTRKMNIRLKIFLPASLMITCICIILGVTSYRSIRAGMVEMGVEEAEIAAANAVDAADGDLLESLKPGSEGTAGYQTQLEDLRTVQQKFGIAYLYTLYTDGSQVYYGIDTDTSDQQSEVGEVFEVSYEELKSVFAGEIYVEDYIDYTDVGNLITVYYPVKNSTGEVVAVVGCDYDADNVVDRLNEITKQVIFVAVICQLLAIVIFNFISGRISGSLRRVDNKIYDIVSNEGDLTQKIDVHTGDEMELIANNTNRLLEYIREIMLTIADNSDRLNAASQNIASSLSRAEGSVTDVSATMEEMSAAMEETSASLNQVNEAIGQAYQAVDTIYNNARSGSDSADAIMKTAQDIQNRAAEEQQQAKAQVQEMSDVVNEKIEKSRAVEEINSLTENIISISEETNLLALNASIEAARAGDAGRGFAVVADEIGKLAANSSEMAEQIRKVSAEVIQAVNELAEESKNMLEFTYGVAMTGYEKLLDTSNDYKEAAVQMSQMMNEFAGESAGIKESMDQIKEVSAAVNSAVEESANGVSGVTETAVNLTVSIKEIEEEAQTNSKVADLLNDEVGKFKLH